MNNPSRLRTISTEAYSRTKQDDQPEVAVLTESMRNRLDNFARGIIEELAHDLEAMNFATSHGDVRIVVTGSVVARRMRLMAGIQSETSVSPV